MRSTFRLSLISGLAIVHHVSALGSQISWNNASGGTFGDSGNWVGGTVPQSTDTASFTLAADYIVDASNEGAFGSLAFSGGTVSFRYGGLGDSTSRALIAETGADVTFVSTIGTRELRFDSVRVSSGAVVAGGHVNGLGGVQRTIEISGIGSRWSIAPNYDLSLGDSLGVSGIRVEAGGMLQSRSVSLGNSTSITSIRSGRATIDGDGTIWNASGHLLIGANGGGTLQVLNGAKINMPSTGGANTTVAVIGYSVPPPSPSSLPVPVALVDGFGSELNSLNGQIRIGDRMKGKLVISNGGVLRSRVGESQTNSSGIIGLNGGTGTVTVSGAGSRWDAGDGWIRTGLNSPSPTGNLLEITNGGVVESGGGRISNYFDRVVIDGAGSMWTTGTLSVGGVLELRGGALSADHVEVGVVPGIEPSILVDFQSGELNVRHLWIGSGQVRLSGSSEKLVRTRQLSFPTTSGSDPSGRLDLGVHAAIIEYDSVSPLAGLTVGVVRGRNGGNWSGPGIRSSLAAADPNHFAVGVAEASETGLTSLFGESFDNTTVVVRYTLLGDATLDGTVNISDFANLAANFNQTGRWFTGDFDYSGTTNIADFALLAQNFNQSLPASRSTVPEPPVAAGVLFVIANLRRRAV